MGLTSKINLKRGMRSKMLDLISFRSYSLQILFPLDSFINVNGFFACTWSLVALPVSTVSLLASQDYKN